MPEVTLCPHYLIDYPYIDVNDIEDKIINSLIKIFELINDNEDFQLILSSEIYHQHQNSYPWQLYNDDNWAGVLNLWCEAIMPQLGRAKLLSTPNSNGSLSDIPCEALADESKLLFENFLEVFGKYGIAKVKHEEAIFSHENCCYPIDYKGYLIIDEKLSNIDVLFNPWLRVYPENIQLPTSGKYQFIPPSIWKNSLKPIRHHKAPYGFIDQNGHIWKLDTLHKDHWDVQLSSQSSRGNYLNITPEGKLLDRK
ncbi:MAG: hypothetical protein EON51_13410 [Acinetobacter sp.]|nr:MAG: hypothetical protein EON51_13410 [Acinetobacter sp.]